MTLGGFLAPLALVATGGLAATAVSLAVIARIRGDFARRTREMAETNRRLLITFDRAAVGMALLDPSGKWLRVNDRFCEIVGRPCEELLALSIQEITHPDDIEADLDLIDGLLASGAEDMRVEKRYLRKDGSIVWAEVSRTLVRDSAGRPEFFVSVNQDISARKEAEDRLVAGEAQYRAIFDSAVDVVIVINVQGIIQSSNPAAERIFGYSPDELIGRDLKMLMPDEAARSEHDSRLARYIQTGERELTGFGREFEGLRKDGTVFPLDLSAAEWTHDDETFFTLIIRDISARKQAEEALVGSEQKLLLLQNEFAHLARVNDLGEMAAAIAHEINQPLAAIANYLNSGLFLADTGYSEENFAFVAEDMARASEQALRAGEIVRRLRAFISQGSGGRTVESVEQLIDAAMALALIDARYAGITVEKEIATSGALVEVDRIQIHQVIVNLLRNAVDAMTLSPPGKARHLKVSAQPTDEDMISVTVADTGPGISADIYDHLFEPFVTSKMNGMGMGLSLCQRLIESHGGTISVDNRPGSGASFTFRLPRFQPNSPT